MENSRLIRILKTFTKADWLQCNRYLKAFSNDGSDTLSLFEYILKNKSDLGHKALQGDTCHQQLFPKKDAKSFRNILSRLTSDILDYLALDQMRKEKRFGYLHTIENLDSRGLYDLTLLHAKKYHQLLDKEDINLWTPWYRHRLLHQLKYSDNPYKDGRNSYLLHEIMQSYHKMNEQFKSFYYLDTCLIEQVEPDKYLPITREIVNYQKVEASNPFNELFSRLIMLYEHPRDELYDQIILILDNSDYKVEEMIVAFVHLRRYLVKALRKNRKYLYKYADLSLWALNKGFLLHEEIIDPITYINVINVLNAADRTAESLNIIESYKEKLPNRNREEIINLCYANLYTNQLKPSEALNYLYKDQKLKRSLKITHRRLVLLNLLHLHHDNFEFIDTQINNFQSLLAREMKKNSIGSNIQKLGNNFCAILKKIVRREIRTKEEFEKIEEVYSGRIMLEKIVLKCGLIK